MGDRAERCVPAQLKGGWAVGLSLKDVSNRLSTMIARAIRGLPAAEEFGYGKLGWTIINRHPAHRKQYSAVDLDAMETALTTRDGKSGPPTSRGKASKLEKKNEEN